MDFAWVNLFYKELLTLYVFFLQLPLCRISLRNRKRVLPIFDGKDIKQSRDTVLLFLLLIFLDTVGSLFDT